jgi:cysteine desulfurase / selenocysteine lyase
MTTELPPLSTEFGPFDGRIWMNCAHQGPLPAPASAAALEAIALKRTPARLSDSLFAAVPKRLRSALARLINAGAEQIALTNSTSYGFNLLAQGLAWHAGDEILCIDGDFPATVVPWLPLADRGVRVRLIRGAPSSLTPELLASEIGPHTRAVCLSWVFSFFGNAIDLGSLGRVCRERGVLFFVNGSQAIGARAIDVDSLPIDALSCCGFKWLCGPYATGFVWLSPPVLERIDYPNPHWLRWQLKAADGHDAELDRRLDYARPRETAADAYDVFCAANFLNFMTWIASLEHLLAIGIESVEAHDQALVERFVSGLPADYRLTSPVEGPDRSTLILFSHRDEDRNQLIASRLQAAGIDLALRGGKLRASPHLYNSGTDVDTALERLSAVA